jgi:hypothetical protein
LATTRYEVLNDVMSALMPRNNVILSDVFGSPTIGTPAAITPHGGKKVAKDVDCG